MPNGGAAKNTKYRIKVSAVRQETLVITARSEASALNKVTVDLNGRVAAEDDSLEHFVICSVEPEETEGV